LEHTPCTQYRHPFPTRRSSDLYRRSGDMTPLNDSLKLAYGEAVYEAAFRTMTTDQLLEASENVTNGVPIATPVFDGAREIDVNRSEEHTSELQSRENLVCRLLL